MLKIWKNTDGIRCKHVACCTVFVEKRIKKHLTDRFIGSFTSDKAQKLNLLKACLQRRLNVILGGTVNELRTIHKELLSIDSNYVQFKQVLLKIFNYKTFCDTGFPLYEEKVWSAYTLVESIGLKTCPYCNDSSTYTIYYPSTRKMRAELDHFLPQSIYPIFALSFYNLIPVCHSCNHVKREQLIDINPYDECFNENDRFVFVSGKSFIPLVSNDTSDSRIEFQSNSQGKMEQVKILSINERYEFHKDKVVDIIRNKAIYNTIYNRSIGCLVPGLSHLSEKNIHRMLYGVSSLPEEFHERTHSKFTNDILTQYQSV